MAEQFEKPKKFSKEWFPYFWHYYKIHTISALLILVLGVITVVEFANKIIYDMSINYIATNMIAYETTEKIVQNAEKSIDDTSGDGEKHVSFAQLNFTPEAMQDLNQVTALENKLMSLFASTDEMLFIFDEMMLRDVLSMNATEGIFLPVKQWCTQNVAEENLFMFGNEAFAVKLTDGGLLNQMGIDASDMYVAVRMNYEPDNEKLNLMLQNCIKFANVLLN